MSRPVGPFMAEALALAQRVRGRTSPNPAVGAVVVADGTVIGRGATQPPGSHHAEVVALQQAGPRARGATLYVTLEPCCIFGRTPPCTDAILAAGIAEVHAATLDPNPQVHGRGVAVLEAHGVRVLLGEGEVEARALIRGFHKWVRTGQPLVIAKFAASLDGRIATRSGESQWITGAAAREHVHRVRDQLDALIIGVGTALADDPQLTARPGGHYPADGRQPLRVVVDSQLRLPPHARLLSQPGRTLIAHLDPAPAERAVALAATGAELLALPAQDGHVDLAALITELGRRGLLEVQIEGGSRLLGAAFDAGLVDAVSAYLAPIIIGGEDALPAVGGQGVARIAAAWRIAHPRLEQLGSDILITGMLVGREESNV
ncbi:MAG: riboflavin biosynthesis protein RibD [Dehalococcoidia bacterium]|nr:MAG: riboflavin biosynthesis protein RibD [Dehalococcoidia bacterium]